MFILPTTIIIVLILWLLSYFLYQRLEQSTHAGVIRTVATKYGVTYSFGQLRFRTTRMNSCLKKITFLRAPIVRTCFTAGIFGGVTCMIVSILLLIGTFWSIVQPEQRSTIMPSLSHFNISSIDYFSLVFATISSTMIHELGHASTAYLENVRIASVGGIISIIFPAAFVDVNNEDLSRLETKSQLRIFCAGIWLNILSMALAVLLLLTFQNVVWPLYCVPDNHIMLRAANNNTFFRSTFGNSVNITYIDDCKINTLEDWRACLKKSAQNQSWSSLGFCVDANDMTESKDLSCCQNLEHSPQKADNYCFHYLNTTDDTLIQQDMFASQTVPYQKCLSLQKQLGHAQCSTNRDCHSKYSANFFCMTATRPKDPARIIRLMLDTREHISLLCDPYLLSSNVLASVHEVHKKYFPLSIGTIFEKFLSYFISISAGLVLLNSLPIYYLDGQWILKSIFDLIFSGSRLGSTFRITVETAILYIMSVISVITLTVVLYEGLVA